MSTDEQLMVEGQNTWSRTYGCGQTDAQSVATLNTELERVGVPTTQGRISIFTMKWANDGFSRIVTTHTYAAALGATRVSSPMGADLHLPWKSFMVVVPAGILDVGGRKFDRIAVASFDEDVPLGVAERFSQREDLLEVKWRGLFLVYESQRRERISVDSSRSAMMACQFENVKDFLFSDTDEIHNDEPEQDRVSDEDGKIRALIIARRIVVGAIYTLQQTNDFTIETRGGPSKRKGLPTHRNVSLGRPLKTDVRPAIRDFIEGRRGKSPSVQVAVIGHYQRYGENKQWQWKEPYWRGSEEAIIQVRPRVVA